MARQIKKLVQKVGSQDPGVRRAAVEALADGDERAIYPLLKALNDENAGVQDAAMRSLMSIGGEVTAYMVLPLLRENTLLRNTALIILKDLGVVSVPLLYSLLNDKDEDVRKFAIDLLGEIRETVDPAALVPCLKDPNANVRAAAAKALGLLAYRDGIPALISALKDEEWVCFSALESLGILKAEDAIDNIASLFQESTEAVRYIAIETLGQIGSNQASDALRGYLPKATDDEKNAIVKSLIQIGITPEMADLSTHLLTMLREGDWEEKEIAIRGITVLGCNEAVPMIVDMAGALDPSVPENEERIELLKTAIKSVDSEKTLLSMLDSSDVKYRGKSFAIEILGEMRNKEAVSRLLVFLDDMRRDLRRASAEALGEIQDPEAVTQLLNASQIDVDAHVRRASIDALGNIRSKAAFRPLMDLIKIERYYDVIERIVGALIKIDSATFLADMSQYSENVREIIAKNVSDLDVLLKLTDDPSKKVKISAMSGLGRIGTETALSKLASFLADNDADIRRAAVVGLGEAGYCSPELVNTLHDSDPWVRFYTIKALTFACERERALELISAMLNDEFVPVVMSAIDAITEIGGREAYEALVVHEEHPNPDVRDKIREALNTL